MRYSALSFVAVLAITSCDAPGRRAAETARNSPQRRRRFSRTLFGKLLRMSWQRTGREP